MHSVQLYTAFVFMLYTSTIISFNVFSTSAFPVNKPINIPFLSMNATSIYDKFHDARNVVLGNNTRAWCAGNSTSHQYIQVNFGKVFTLQGIATKGLNFSSTDGIGGYVTAYKMKFSLDGLLWHGYRENIFKDKIFPGNNNPFSISSNKLKGCIDAKFARIYPVDWFSNICMRLGFFGVPSTGSVLDSRCNTNASTEVINKTTSPCPLGFHRVDHTCTDTDECGVKSTCPANSLCLNFPGSFKCVCSPGYLYTKTSICIDIDECSTRDHSCSAYAHCINIAGSYICVCKSGYYDNGRACLDVDECRRNLHSCHDDANCTNTEGSYTCICNSGYEGDGFNCTTDGVSSEVSQVSHLGIVIGVSVVAIVLLISISVACIVKRRRRQLVVRRPKKPNQTNSRPSSTVIGQIDKLFDDERKSRDSMSLNSIQFSIPSAHPSLTALNNIELSTKNSTYQSMQL